MTAVNELFSESQIAARITELGRAIRRDAGNSQIFLIGILKGSSIFLADLLRALEGDVHYEWVSVLREMSDTETADAMEIDFLTHFDLNGRNVYVLKDIVTTGVIENYLLTQFRLRNPRTLKLVSLIDCPDLRTVEIATDYSAFSADRNVFVGYGLEYEGRFGNLRHIGTLNQ